MSDAPIEPDSVPAGDPTSPGWKRSLRKGALVVLVWCVVFEAGAWGADAIWDFRAPLMERLKTASGSPDPVPETAPDWPAGVVRLRVPDRGEARETPYALGGVVIEGAWPDAKLDPVEAEEVAERAAGRPRVFVLGGSAALGYPYPFEDSLASQLQTQLPEHAVFNAGQVGWCAGQVLGLAQVLLDRFDPAVFVVLSGNNEFIQWSPATAPEDDPAIQRLLAHSRLLAAALYLGHRGNTAGTRVPQAPLVGYRHAIDHPDESFPLTTWAQTRTAHLNAFRGHLDALVSRAERSGVQVVMLTVPFNPRLSPSFHRLQPLSARSGPVGEEVRALARRGADELDAGQAEAAVATAREALALDPEPAALHALKGAALEALAELPAPTGEAAFHRNAAFDAYVESRERTIGNLGTRVGVNVAVRSVAARHPEVALIDADAIARERWRTGAPTIEDDCHPTPAFHGVLAARVAAVLSVETAAPTSAAQSPTEGP